MRYPLERLLQITITPTISAVRSVNSFSKTRVRFAPSPTGYLHLGGLRTALYNYLFAKSCGGTFILRIEDTDQSRKVQGSEDALIKDLRWAGLEYDEGPGKSGDYGPYVQSLRLEIYKEHVDKLLKNGSAYRCFCTERRLNIIRRDAIKTGQIPKYDNKCRNLSAQEIGEKMKKNSPYCVRFKLTTDCLSFEDMIYGGIAYDVTLNEGDPVILKGDGYPTYHLANVVDDHLMGITHVLRGVEWQISTTKHLLLYRAFGWSPPLFGHLPLIVNSDGTKLSKRQNDVRVDDYKNKGIFPLALVNFIMSFGGGFDHGNRTVLRTMDQMIKEFQIDKVSSHPSKLDWPLLLEFNRDEIKRRLEDKESSRNLVLDLQNQIRQAYGEHNTNTTEENVRKVLETYITRVTGLEELASKKYSFLWIVPEKVELNAVNAALLTALTDKLAGIEQFEHKLLKNLFLDFCKENEIKFPEFMKLLRSVLSGTKEGPGVAEMMELFGAEESLKRIKAVL